MKGEKRKENENIRPLVTTFGPLNNKLRTSRSRDQRQVDCTGWLF